MSPAYVVVRYGPKGPLVSELIYDYAEAVRCLNIARRVQQAELKAIGVENASY